MATKISGTSGVDKIQDGAVSTAAKLGAVVVTPVKTQVGAAPSSVVLTVANGYGSTNTMIRRFSNVITNQGSDISYVDSATLGAHFTINSNGIYTITYIDQFTVSGHYLGISKDTTTPATAIQNVAISEIMAVKQVSQNSTPDSIPWSGFLAAGSVIRAHTSGNASGAWSGSAKFSITRIA